MKCSNQKMEFNPDNYQDIPTISNIYTFKEPFLDVLTKNSV